MVVYSIFKETAFNQAIETYDFRDSLKTANIAPVFKRNDPLDKLNYRPVSILPLLSNVYKRLIYNQLYAFAENILNSIIFGFPKVHRTQRALFKSLHLWQK